MPREGHCRFGREVKSLLTSRGGFEGLGIPLPLLSAISGKWMPLSVEIPCVLAIYGLASILHRKNSVFSNFS
jgi:hypothetical protein